MQLDIFEHSRDVMLRNDVVHALERRDGPAARVAWDTLARECPVDECLASLLLLVKAVEGCGQPVFRDHDALRHARLAQQNDIEPAAQRTFGDKAATAWLGPLWRELAQRAAPLAFRADHGEDHAAPLWLRAGDWMAAAEAVKCIESWRRIPAPLAWMVQARLKLYGLQATWGMLAEVAWLSPRRLDELVSHACDPSLQQLVDKFESSFDGTGDASDLAWFPAWVLTERPGLAAPMALAQPSQHSAPEKALRVMSELLGLERQGRHHDVVARRKTLRDLQASLYAAYMKTR